MSNSFSLTKEQSNAIEMFFKDPLKPQTDKSIEIEGKSFLYMIRKDANVCLNVTETNQEIAIWAATTVIFAGIDLLGQFYTGKQEDQVGYRFKTFCEDFITNGDVDQAEAIYMLRNAFVHRYGLFSKTRNGNIKYEFTVTYKEVGLPLVTKTFDDGQTKKYTVELFVLHKKFEEAVMDYKKRVCANKNNELNTFMNVYQSYGKIGHEEQIIASPYGVNYSSGSVTIYASGSSLINNT